MADVVSLLSHTKPGLDNRLVGATLEINLEHNQGRFKSKSVPKMEEYGRQSVHLSRDSRPVTPRSRVSSASKQSNYGPLSTRSVYSPYAKTNFEFRSLISPNPPDTPRSKPSSAADRNRSPSGQDNNQLKDKGKTPVSENNTNVQPQINKQDKQLRSPERISSGLRKIASDDNVQKLTRSPSSEAIKMLRKPKSSKTHGPVPLKALPRSAERDEPRTTQPIRANSDLTPNLKRNEVAPWASNKHVSRTNVRTRSGTARDGSNISGVNNTQDDPPTNLFKETTQNPNQTNKRHASKQLTAHHLSQNTTGDTHTARLISNANESTAGQSDQSMYALEAERAAAFVRVGQANTNTIQHGQTDKPCRHATNLVQSIVQQNNSHKREIKAATLKENSRPATPLHTHNSTVNSGNGNGTERLTQQDAGHYNNASLPARTDQSARPATPYKGRPRRVNREPAVVDKETVTNAPSPAGRVTRPLPLPSSPEDINSGEPEALINAQNIKQGYSAGNKHTGIDSKQVKARQGIITGGGKVSESKAISHARGGEESSKTQQLFALQRYGGTQKEDTIKHSGHSQLLTNTRDRTAGDKDNAQVCLDSGDKQSLPDRNKSKLLRARGKLNEGLRRTKETNKTRDKSQTVIDGDKSSAREQRFKIQSRGLTETNILPNKTPSLPLPGKTFRSVSNENFKVRTQTDSTTVPVLDASKHQGLSTRSVYLSSQSLDNFAQFDKGDFKSALQRLKTGSGPGVTSSSRGGARSTVSEYSNASHPLGDIIEDDSECESDLHSDLEDNSPPWKSNRFSVSDTPKRAHSGGNHSPWHSADTDRNNNKVPDSKLHLPQDTQKPRKLRASLTRPYLHNSRNSEAPSHFQSSSMPNMTQNAVAMPSYATPLTSQMSSSKINFTSNQSLIRPKMDKQISVSLKPFASSSMANIHGKSPKEDTSPRSPPWSSTRPENRPKSRRASRGRASPVAVNGNMETNAVPNNSPVTMQRSVQAEQQRNMNNGQNVNDVLHSHIHNGKSSVIESPSTRMPNRSMDTHKRSYIVGLKDESHNDSGSFMQNTHERPSSSKGRPRRPSGTQEVPFQNGLQSELTSCGSTNQVNTRMARPQSSKGRGRTPSLPIDDDSPPANAARPTSSKGRARGETIFTDHDQPSVPSSRPKSSKGRPRSGRSNDFSIDLSAITSDHSEAARPPRPVSGLRNNYRKPTYKDIDLDDSGNDTDVDGEIEILDLDKLDDEQRDSQDSWDKFEVGVTGDVQYEFHHNLKEESSSSSRSSRSSDLSNPMDVHAHRYHGNQSTTAHKHRAVDKYLDPTLQPDGYTPDTPRLTPMQDSIRKSHNSLLINGGPQQRNNKRLDDNQHRQSHNHSSNFHGPCENNTGSPVDKGLAPSKEQRKHALLSQTSKTNAQQEKLISKYRNRAILDNDTSYRDTKGGLPNESRLNARNRKGTPIVHNYALPRKLEPLSSPSNHSDSECDMTLLQNESSPDSGINVRLQRRRQSGPAGIMTKPQKARRHKSKQRPEQSVVNSNGPLLRQLPSPSPFKSPLSDSQFSFSSRDKEEYTRLQRPSQPDIYSSHRGTGGHGDNVNGEVVGDSKKRPLRQTRSFPLN